MSLNKATISVLFSQSAAMLYGGAFLIFVPLNLSAIEQGFWFLLMALGAMSRLADMGFLQLVLTYSGHAKVGSERHQREVLFFTAQWRNKVIFWVFPLIFVVGIGVISLREFELVIMLSWAWYIIALAILFYLNYFLAIIEGSGGITFSHYSRGSVYILASILTALVLNYSHSLIALPLGIFIAVLIVLFWVLKTKSSYFLVGKKNLQETALLKVEFIQLFKKTSMSWTGGYLGTHAIVPLVYVFLGPISSGLAGMTLNVFLALQNFSNVFLVSIIPTITGHIATKSQWLAREILLRGLFKSLGVFIFVVTTFSLLVYLYPSNIISERIFHDENLIFLSVGFGLQIVITSIAIYIRAHKKEPFALMSLVTSILGVLVLLITLNSNFSNWVFLGFFISSLLALIWSVKILFNWRQAFE